MVLRSPHSESVLVVYGSKVEFLIPRLGENTGMLAVGKLFYMVFLIILSELKSSLKIFSLYFATATAEDNSHCSRH
jgi:hypothetical protein